MTFGVMLPPSNLPPHFPQPGFDPIVELEAALIAKDEIIAKLLPVIDSKEGDVAKGKIAFTTTCSVCHKLNGEGKEVGPVLDGIGVHGTNELLIHIIDPSRVVDNEHVL